MLQNIVKEHIRGHEKYLSYRPNCKMANHSEETGGIKTILMGLLPKILLTS